MATTIHRHDDQVIDPVRVSRRRITGRSVGFGAVAGSAMLVFYVVVVRLASGSWSHLGSQVRKDWYYLIAIAGGFAVQVALVAEIRHRHRVGHGTSAMAGVGAGASTAGMVACCAHHIADLLPVVGVTSAAGFLTDYRVAFMLVGIGINTAAIVVAARRLRALG